MPHTFLIWTGGKIKNRGAEYRTVKAAWRELLLQALYQHWPQCQGHVTYTDVATPLSNDFYLGTVHGEVYGLEHTVERFASCNALRAQHPKTTVPGLYLTGQDAFCGGVVSALASGLLTAANISYVALLRCVLECVVS